MVKPDSAGRQNGSALVVDAAEGAYPSFVAALLGSLSGRPTLAWLLLGSIPAREAGQATLPARVPGRIRQGLIQDIAGRGRVLPGRRS